VKGFERVVVEKGLEGAGLANGFDMVEEEKLKVLEEGALNCCCGWNPFTPFAPNVAVF
jgi:hypothetical protein